MLKQIDGIKHMYNKTHVKKDRIGEGFCTEAEFMNVYT